MKNLLLKSSKKTLNKVCVGLTAQPLEDGSNTAFY